MRLHQPYISFLLVGSLTAAAVASAAVCPNPMPFVQPHPSYLSDDTLIAATEVEPLSTDSAALLPDSMALQTDSLAVPEKKKKPAGGGLTAVVNYTAHDSLVFSTGNLAFLYGQSQVTYDDIKLDAERIQMTLDSSLVHAYGVPDSTGKLIGSPVFVDKSGQYDTKAISYNFKSAKGYITDVVTQQGEGYVTGGITKKMPDNDIYLKDGRYTTCDYHECPHFYIQLTKARVRPNKNVVTGPAYLVVSDVPLPIAIPFGFFPFTKSYSSGVIMPTYGADQTRGLYLRDGGYYFAINDYIDLSLLGEIYTKGSWGISAASKYAWRYKFRGNFSFSYLKTITGDKGLPDYSSFTNIKAVWSHSQDSRFNPNVTLSASVNFTTSGYDRNNLTSYYSTDMTQSTKSSTVNMSYKVPNKPWTISASTSITQRTQDSTLVVSLPDLSISMSRVYPFKRKVQSGADKWYEKIAMTYSGRITNSVTCKQDEFRDQSLLKDWNNGMQHSIPISATFTALRYINITPSINFTDRMYSHKTNKFYDATVMNEDGTYGSLVSDTTYGFYNVYNFSTSLSANTKLYGFYKPLPMFNSRLVAVRHLFTPTLSFTYTPDFSDPKWGSWTSYDMPDESSPTGWKKVKYSPFQGATFGTTSQGRTGSISLSLSNNIEAKFRSDKDTTGYKKVSIIDNLSTSISYNLVADSMRWSSTIPVTMNLKFGKAGSMNLSATFDTYMYEVTSSGSPYHIDKPRWEAGRLPRLMNTGYSYSYSLSNDKLAQWFGLKDKDDDAKVNAMTQAAEDEMEDTPNEDADPFAVMEEKPRKSKNSERKSGSKYDADGYLFWSVPWSMNISYTMRYAYSTFNVKKKEYNLKLTHSATVSGSIQPTQNWNFSYNFTYDINAHEVTYMNINCTRDMHCWNLTASLNPMGQYASFNVCVAVKASMLRDMKYEKTSVSRSNKINWYDD
jgi:hypothetical protein